MLEAMLTADHEILNIQLFVLDNFISRGAIHGSIVYMGDHRRIKVTYEGLDAENLIRSEINDRRGRTVVSCKCDLPAGWVEANSALTSMCEPQDGG